MYFCAWRKGKIVDLRLPILMFQSVTSVIHSSEALLSICAEMMLLWHSDKAETFQQKCEKETI